MHSNPQMNQNLFNYFYINIFYLVPIFTMNLLFVEITLKWTFFLWKLVDISKRLRQRSGISPSQNVLTLVLRNNGGLSYIRLYHLYTPTINVSEYPFYHFFAKCWYHPTLIFGSLLYEKTCYNLYPLAY